MTAACQPGAHLEAAGHDGTKKAITPLIVHTDVRKSRRSRVVWNSSRSNNLRSSPPSAFDEVCVDRHVEAIRYSGRDIAQVEVLRTFTKETTTYH